MKKIILLLALVISLSACKDGATKTAKTSEQSVESETNWGTINDYGIAVIDDSKAWWSYHYYEINLNSNFVPLSTDSTYLKKADFLNQIIEDQLLPIKILGEEGISTYKLYPVQGTARESVISTIKNEAQTALQFHEMKGMTFPDVDFTTIEGKKWTTERLKGKFVVYKTWFINCTACIKEFPELNEFVDQNKDENVVFISLALDEESELKKFLKTKEFDYQTVAKQSDLITNQLGLNVYPTHILVSPSGTIVYTSNSATKMIDFIDKNGGFSLPPPPPPPSGNN